MLIFHEGLAPAGIAHVATHRSGLGRRRHLFSLWLGRGLKRQRRNPSGFRRGLGYPALAKYIQITIAPANAVHHDHGSRSRFRDWAVHWCPKLIVGDDFDGRSRHEGRQRDASRDRPPDMHLRAPQAPSPPPATADGLLVKRTSHDGVPERSVSAVGALRRYRTDRANFLKCRAERVGSVKFRRGREFRPRPRGRAPVFSGSSYHPAFNQRIPGSSPSGMIGLISPGQIA